MARETGQKELPDSSTGASVNRRRMLKFGTFVAALTGASAVSAIGVTRAEGATVQTSPSTYVPVTEKGVASGVATLDSESRIPMAQIPDLSGIYEQGHSTDLRKWYGALASVYSAPANILVIGDSNSEGSGAGSYDLRWQKVLQDILRKRFQPPSVDGAEHPYVTASPRVIPALTGHPATATGGGQASYGLGLRARDFARDGIQSMTYTFKGDRFKILHTKGPSAGRMQIVIDGAPGIVVDTWKAAPLTFGNVWDSGALTYQTHTVVLTRSAGTNEPLFIEGFLAFNGDLSAGIRVIDAARHGATVSTFTGSTTWQSAVAAAGPYGLCIMPWGANDSTIPTSAEAFRAGLVALIASLRSSAGFSGSILLVEMPKRGKASETTWTGYRAAIEAVAAGDPDIAALDLRRRMPDAGTAEAMAQDLYSDEVHYKAKGHGWIAQQIASAITPR